MSRKLLIAALVAVGLILVLYGCSGCCTAEAQTGAQTVSAKPMGVFRDFVWGVSEQDVMAYETATFHKKEGNSLFFLLPRDRSVTPILKPMLRYDFTDGRLTSATFDYFELSQPDGQRVLDLFSKHEMDLTAQFGKPAKEEFNWKNEYYRKFPEFWGRALYSKDLWLRTTWQSGDTEVVLQTYRDQNGYRLFYTASKISARKDTPSELLQLDIVPGAKP